LYLYAAILIKTTYQFYSKADQSIYIRSLQYWELSYSINKANESNLLPIKLEYIIYAAYAVFIFCGLWPVTIILIIGNLALSVLIKSLKQSAIHVIQEAKDFNGDASDNT
jgi:hypothetical protein